MMPLLLSFCFPKNYSFRDGAYSLIRLQDYIKKEFAHYYIVHFRLNSIFEVLSVFTLHAYHS